MPIAPWFAGARCPDCDKVHGTHSWELTYWKAQLKWAKWINPVVDGGGPKYMPIKCSDCARKKPG